MKTCPDCAEQVQDAAKVCRYCGYRFEPESSAAGWYKNPEGSGVRWWDGSKWTDHVHQPGQRAVTPSEVEALEQLARRQGIKMFGIGKTFELILGLTEGEEPRLLAFTRKPQSGLDKIFTLGITLTDVADAILLVTDHRLIYKTTTLGGVDLAQEQAVRPLSEITGATAPDASTLSLTLKDGPPPAVLPHVNPRGRAQEIADFISARIAPQAQ